MTVWIVQRYEDSESIGVFGVFAQREDADKRVKELRASVPATHRMTYVCDSYEVKGELPPPSAITPADVMP